MKNIILHIGLHKTGSSSIQQSLFENRNEIREQGYHYFCKEVDGTLTALPQQWVLLNGTETPKFRHPEKFRELIKNQELDNIIISIEALSWFITEQAISELHKVFEEFHVEIVIYLRRQDQQLVSYIQEGSKNRHKPSAVYYGHCTRALPDIKEKNYLDYLGRIELLDKYFGKNNLKIRIFEKDNLYCGDVVLDFCSLYGLKIKNQKRINESIGFEKQKVGQLLNLCNIKGDLEDIIRNSLSNEGKMLPCREKAAAFYRIYKSNNDELNRRYCLIDRENLFEENFDSYPKLPEDKWTEDSANRAILKILKSFSFYINKKDEENRKLESAALLRDEALKIENENLDIAYYLMSRANEIKPEGKFIESKKTEYEKKLKTRDGL